MKLTSLIIVVYAIWENVEEPMPETYIPIGKFKKHSDKQNSKGKS